MSSETRPDSQEVAKDPFMKWYADMTAWGSHIVETKSKTGALKLELLLSGACATGFAIQIDPDGEVALGIPEPDREAFFSVQWERAKLMPDFKKASYLVLECPDVATPGGTTSDPVVFRLVMPIEGAKASALAESSMRASKLRLRPMEVRGVRAVMTVGDARVEMPLSFDEPKAKAAGKPAAKKPGKN